MIAVIDYGVGNLFSLKSSLAQLGQDTVVTADPDTIRKADRLILPGVGAFGDAMDKLVATGLVPVIREEAEKSRCWASAWACSCCLKKSYEYGDTRAWDFIQGEVCPLEPDLTDKSLKVPQIGWNALHIVKDDPLFQYIREGEYVYYVHSYYGKTVPRVHWRPASIPSRSPARYGRARCTAPSSTRKKRRHRPAHPESVCGVIRRI